MGIWINEHKRHKLSLTLLLAIYLYHNAKWTHMWGTASKGVNQMQTKKNKSQEEKAAGDWNKNNFLETDGRGLRKMIKWRTAQKEKCGANGKSDKWSEEKSRSRWRHKLKEQERQQEKVCRNTERKDSTNQESRAADVKTNASQINWIEHLRYAINIR